MSTPATAKSKYLSDLVNEFGRVDKTLKIGCNGLEEAIEILDYKKIDNLLKKYLAKVKSFGADVVVLGCTHYLLIKSKIQSSLGKNVQVIDSGKPIAKRIKEILKENDMLSNKKDQDIYYTTADPLNFAKVASLFLKQSIGALKAN